MEILKLLTFISLFFMVSGGTDDDDTTNNDNTSEELPARQSKCSGCHKPSHTHIWGPPGPNCDGPPIIPPADNTKPSTRKRIRTVANPQSPAAENPLVITGNPEEVLQQQLATLALEEQQLQNQIRDRDLQRQIQDATARVAALRNELHEESSLHSDRAPEGTPAVRFEGVDSLLSLPRSGVPCEDLLYRFPSASRGTSLPEIGRPTQTNREVDILLRPFSAAAAPNGKKVLRIVDYINSYVPNEEEQVLSDIGGTVTKLVLKQKSKKKLLHNVTPQEFSIANIRIFNQLLFTGSLSSSKEVQEYLAYSIKILQLGSRFEWTSVMTLDDEFRNLQCLTGATI